MREKTAGIWAGLASPKGDEEGKGEDGKEGGRDAGMCRQGDGFCRTMRYCECTGRRPASRVHVYGKVWEEERKAKQDDV